MIAVYVSPDAMTIEHYKAAHDRLEAVAPSPQGRMHHSCFGEDGHLMVYDVWESQADFDAFAEHLLPILAELGITSSRPPDVMPVVALEQ